MPRRKGNVLTPSPALEEQLAQEHFEYAQADAALRKRNRTLHVLFHGLGYTQTKLAELCNVRLPGPHHNKWVTEDTVQKALSRMDAE